jgi:DNA-binding MarR family transcriptional regulator
MSSSDNVSANRDRPTTYHRIYRLLHDVYVLLDAGDRRQLRDYNITLSQYTLLVLLGSGEGQRLTTLSDRLLVARSTITRLVSQMEAAGLVHRVDDPDDRRAQQVALTPAGLDLLHQARIAHEDSLEERFSKLSEADQKRIAVLLRKLRSSLRENLGIADSDG